ncbi:alpha/beta hydrolase [Lentibacillus cibarius]|uniref:Alpha/beta hydrolase n=1 Tax=Lentibacillus cibarius TaxID=2583219 RepID=A0A5S3R7D7_9BACI|nr:alpha/beta hydrolase [Lentibacillus cibarius]TMN21643.1 alpha/beta hydrolase [Lentibacillus cibarius]
MKKKLLIAASSVIVVLLVGLLFVGNYFYGKGIKRGTDIELHRESTEVNASASVADRQSLAENKAWYDNQEKQTLSLTSFDDLTLQAKYIKNEADSQKTVILAHGFRKTGDDMGKMAKFYYDKGFSVLLPDARGHGASEGDYIGYGWHDRLDYIDWVDRMIDECRAEEIILHGSSMGATTVLMASGEKLPREVKGIVAASGYSTVKAELAHQLKYLYHLPSFPLLDVTSMITKVRAGYMLGEASAVEQVKQNTLPLMIIHGGSDELVPTDMAEEIYDAAGGDKSIWIVPDAGHTKAFDIKTKTYEKRVGAFVDQVLIQ